MYFFVFDLWFWPLVFVFAFDFSMISMVFPKCASFSRWFLSICQRFSSIFHVVHRFPIVFIFQHCSSILSCLASIFPWISSVCRWFPSISSCVSSTFSWFSPISFWFSFLFGICHRFSAFREKSQKRNNKKTEKKQIKKMQAREKVERTERYAR